MSLRNENSACEKKTPEYSGVFFGQEENIGFCQNQNLKEKFRIFDKLFSALAETRKTYICITYFGNYYILYIEQINKMSSVSNKKRSHSDSGASSDKRQRLSSDEPDVLETKESEALVEQVNGDDTKCRTGCIYLLTNPINGKVYVGQTLNYMKRMNDHKNSGKTPKYYFSYAIKKYGWENFTKEILIDNVPEEYLDNLEINYIAFYNSFKREKGYNLTNCGGGISGYRHTEEQNLAKSKRQTKNHNVEGGGCVFFYNKNNKWVAIECLVSGKKHIGYYFTKDKAIEALKLYNETGQCIPSDLLRRINGSGSVTYVNQCKKWSAMASRKGSKRGAKYIGQYFTKEKAIAALKLYNETGTRMPSDTTRRKKGTGSIQELISKTKGIRFTAMYRRKKVGVFDTYEEAEQALKAEYLN